MYIYKNVTFFEPMPIHTFSVIKGNKYRMIYIAKDDFDKTFHPKAPGEVDMSL